MNDAALRKEATTIPVQVLEETNNFNVAGHESAGGLLRTAREKSGLHIAALAAALKVPVRKLEALEGNRWEELTDATFTRALASSVARHLKADPVAVLAALPSHHPVPLVISDGLGRAATDHPTRSARHAKPFLWSIAALLVATVGIYLFPQFWPEAPNQPTPEAASSSSDLMPQGTPTPAEPLVVTNLPDPAVQPLERPSAAVPTTPLDATPAPTALPNDVKPSAAVSNGQPLMVVKASRDTWMEATDNSGRLRIQRVVKAGEEVSFADAASLAVVIGNAAGAQVTVHGQPMDLTPVSKNNIARFEVK